MEFATADGGGTHGVPRRRSDQAHKCPLFLTRCHSMCLLKSQTVSSRKSCTFHTNPGASPGEAWRRGPDLQREKARRPWLCASTKWMPVPHGTHVAAPSTGAVSHVRIRAGLCLSVIPNYSNRIANT